MANSNPEFIVKIECDTPRGKSAGTGFLVNERGIVATCLHVVADCQGDILVSVPYTKPWLYHILDSSTEDDIALLGLKGRLLPASATPFAVLAVDAAGESFKPGEQVLAYGHSAREHFDSSQGLSCSTSGVDEGDARIGLTGSIHSGDSGGPILNADRHVIGMVQVRDPNRSGRAMAIPVALVADLLHRSYIRYYEPESDFRNPASARSLVPLLNQKPNGARDSVGVGVDADSAMLDALETFCGKRISVEGLLHNLVESLQIPDKYQEIDGFPDLFRHSLWSVIKGELHRDGLVAILSERIASNEAKQLVIKACCSIRCI